MAIWPRDVSVTVFPSELPTGAPRPGASGLRGGFDLQGDQFSCDRSRQHGGGTLDDGRAVLDRALRAQSGHHPHGGAPRPARGTVPAECARPAEAGTPKEAAIAPARANDI